mgnify:CR=1 FL=1
MKLRHFPILAPLAIAACLAGCTDNIMVLGNENGDPRFLETNFMSFEHPFTDKGEADVRARAERLCGYQKRQAVQTERACTLEKCVTNYQCVTPKDVKTYGL